MKKLIGFLSLCFVTSSQLFGATFPLNSLLEKEIEIIKENIDDSSIQYLEVNDEFIIEDSLEKELRLNGILKTQSVEKTTVCTGGGH